MLAVILNCFTGVMALPCLRCSRRISVTARWRRPLYFGAGCRSDANAGGLAGRKLQNLMMPAYYLMVVAVVGLITA